MTNEPSQMSEPAGWINENLPKEQPKKLSWLQKIRDYEYQKYMREYYSDMRDVWHSIAIAKSRELDLMTKVADNWQKKLIEANKRIEQLEKELEK